MYFNDDIELYLYIDLDINKDDLELIQKCIGINLKVYFKQYNISKIICCNDLVEKTNTDDVIKNGVLTFHNMFKQLKLKSKNQAWFVYLANGDIQETYKNTCVILLNTQPNKKECFYTINTNSFQLNNIYTKQEKMYHFKKLNDNLKKLFIQIGDDTVKKIFY